jgi:hypothetical protein
MLGLLHLLKMYNGKRIYIAECTGTDNVGGFLEYKDFFE